MATKPKPRRQKIKILTRFVAAVRMAAVRMSDLLVSIHVEACEIASVVGCLAWLIPLKINPEFLHTSVYLQQMNDYVPRPVLLNLFGVLFWYQVTTLLLGGVPSEFIKSGKALRRWMIARQAGILAAIVVWGFIAALLTQIAITPGSVLYGFVSLGSVWGYWRLSLLIAIETEVLSYRAVETEALLIRSAN